MNFPEKSILINNLMNIENYLGFNVYYNVPLNSLELRDNIGVSGVKELLALIPDGYDPDKLKSFYNRTGLRTRVEYYDSHYTMVMYDKDGRYPREDSCIWNKDFMENLGEHPEWLTPQEEPDILIRYVHEIEPIQCCEEKAEITIIIKYSNS